MSSLDLKGLYLAVCRYGLTIAPVAMISIEFSTLFVDI